jgi:MCP family monocarboxylic acid transporter-like MFS transporter 10
MFPGANAEVIVVCIGGISGFSRLASGKLADIPQFNRVWIMQFSFVLLGVATSLIPFAGHYGVLVFLACLMGIGDGCFICMLGPIAFDLLGPRGMGQGIGMLLGIMSIPMTIGPPLAGIIITLMSINILISTLF